MPRAERAVGVRRAARRRGRGVPPDGPMRIAYVVTRSDHVGGASIHVRDLSEAMLARGHDVAVLVGGEGHYVDMLRERGIPVYPLPRMLRDIRPLREPGALREMTATLARIGPDLVSTHSAKAGFLGRMAARRVGVPSIYTAHGWCFADGVQGNRRLYRMLEGIAARLSQRIITVSEYDRQLALRTGVGSPERLQTIHNGMPDVRPELLAHPAEERCRIVMVGRFEDQKDQGTLVRALAALRELPWELRLVGDGELRPNVEALAEQLGVAERVVFLGVRSDVAEQLADADVFVLASHWEGFPRSILEAMRAGLPVVASRVGGVAESVADGDTGMVVEPADVTAMTRALRIVIGSPALRLRMGARGRERYLREFTFERMFRETEEVYRAFARRAMETAVD